MQVATLKDAVAKKDEEIARLRLLKTNGNYSIGVGRSSQQLSGVKSSDGKAASDMDNSSEDSDKHSDAGSQQSVDNFRHHKEFFQQSRLAVVGGVQNYPEDIESNLNLADGGKSPNGRIQLLECGDADTEEKLSDISDGVLSLGTQTDASVNSISESAKSSADTTEK